MTFETDESCKHAFVMPIKSMNSKNNKNKNQVLCRIVLCLAPIIINTKSIIRKRVIVKIFCTPHPNKITLVYISLALRNRINIITTQVALLSPETTLLLAFLNGTGSSWISMKIFGIDYALGCFKLTVGAAYQPRLSRLVSRSHIQIKWFSQHSAMNHGTLSKFAKHKLYHIYSIAASNDCHIFQIKPCF